VLRSVDLDEDADSVISLFNPTDEPIDFTVGALVAEEIELHEVLADSVDPVVASSFDPATGTFSVPARTAAVFVELCPDTTPPVASIGHRRTEMLRLAALRSLGARHGSRPAVILSRRPSPRPAKV